MQNGQNENVSRSEAKRVKSWRSSLVRNMCLIGVFTALMCVLAPLSIPLDPVAITLATLALYSIGAILDWKIASFPILIYLLLGLAGLPVFSKFQAGPSVLFGPSGGFLIGYVPCVFVESLLISKFKNHKWIYPVAMVLGTVLLYAVGTVWFVYYLNREWGAALMACVVPFLPLDTVKIAIASIVGIRVRPFADKHE